MNCGALCRGAFLAAVPAALTSPDSGGGAGTIREMALVWGHYSMDWSGGNDVDCHIQTSAGAAPHRWSRAAAPHCAFRTSGRADSGGAVAEDRGWQARGLGSLR